jgi:hypothetical protein
MNGKDQPDIHGNDNPEERATPPSRVLVSRKAAKIYWKEKSVQLSCELDCSLPLPLCMEDNAGRYIKGVTASAMTQSLISIALSSNQTVLLPSGKEVPVDVDYTVLMPNVDLPMEDNHVWRKNPKEIGMRSAWKHLRITISHRLQ